MSSFTHIRHLAETIGPRGSTTRAEARAAEYAAGVLATAGLNPIVEPFTSARSYWQPYALFSGLVLLAAALFWSPLNRGSVLAALLTAAALGSLLLELTFRPNPLRWLLPKGASQNVHVRVAPSGEVRQRVVLLGHLDTHRTPIFFSSPRWLSFISSLIPAALGAAALLLGLILAGAFSPAGWLRWIALPPVLILACLCVLTLHADLTPFSPGANDNATAAGVVLSVAEHLAQRPLEHTELWALLSGCEEVGCYGARAFAQAHRAELAGAAWMPLEMLGSRGAVPCYETAQTFLLTTRSDPGLVALADQVAMRRPELGARPNAFRGAFSEGVVAGRYGFRLLTLTTTGGSFDGSGWHRMSDTVDKLEMDVLARCEEFLWEVLSALDQQGEGKR